MYWKSAAEQKNNKAIIAHRQKHNLMSSGGLQKLYMKTNHQLTLFKLQYVSSLSISPARIMNLSRTCKAIAAAGIRLL